MQSQRNVSVNLELGHSARLKRGVTTEGASHDWAVFVRRRDDADIPHFVEKVVFRLHDSFPNPRRVRKDPPYQVEESGSAGFLVPMEVHFKNKELPKKVCFKYDRRLDLQSTTSAVRRSPSTTPTKTSGPVESKILEEGISPDT